MIVNLLRGLWMLRHPELRRRLGDLRDEEIALNALRSRFPKTKIAVSALLIGLDRGSLTLGEGSTISHGTILAVGDALNGYASIEIGESTWIGEYNNFRAAAGAPIIIGSGCLIAQFCTIVSTNHETKRGARMIDTPPPKPARGVTIGSDVWLAAGVTVLPEVQIADGAVIAANSVVNRDVPPFEIWGGSPARKIGERE